MIETFKKLLKQPKYRYLIVGGSIYVLELIVIVIAQKMGASPIVAVAWSFWIGLVISFGLQKLFTFGDRRMHHKVVLSQFVAVCLLVLFNFGFTILVTNLLSPPFPPVVTRTVALGITTIWNFYLYKTRIFKAAEVVY
jgi:putative flippase GtrA